MSQNYNPQNDPNRGYGIGDYYQQGGQPPPYDMPKAMPDPYGQLEPPANGIFNKWLKVLTRPSPATFASEIPDANWNTTIIGVLIYAVFWVLIRVLVSSALGFPIDFSLGTVIGTIISSVIVLIIGSGMIYLLAKTVGGGHGDFMTQTYLYSLYTMPLGIITSVLALVPFIGGLANLALAIFELFLIYYMLQPAHRISADKARQVVFVLVLMGIILVVIFLFLAFNFFFVSLRL